MLLFTIAAFIVLALCNYVISGAKLLYPPVVLCAVWAVDLFMVWCSVGFFYPLSDQALYFFLFGAVAFSLGAAVVSRYQPRPPAAAASSASDKLVTWGVIALCALTPIFYYRLASAAGGYGAPTFLMSARMAMLDLAETGNDAFFDIISSASILIGLLAFNEREISKRRAILAMVLAFLLNAMTGGRAGLVFLALGCICIDWIKTRRLRWKLALPALLFFVVAFGAMAFFLHKGLSGDESVLESAAAAGKQVVLYSAGGPVGFGEVVKQPNTVTHNWQVDHFLLQIAKKFGADVDIPSQHSEFVTLGPGGLIGNVYTMYFGYMDWGIPGMMLLLFAAGLVITLVFRHALFNPRTPALVYTILFTQTVLSIFSENFYRGLGTTLRMFLFAWTIYSAPAWLTAFRRVMASAVREQMKAAPGISAPEL